MSPEFTEFTGELQDAGVFLTGVDVLTGERLPWGWQLGAGAAFFVPFVGAVQIRHGVRALNNVISSTNTIRAGRRFSRFMSRAERDAVEETHLLREGKPGETFFTTNKFQKAASAKSKLSLRDPPELRVDFKLKKDLQVAGPRRVGPKFGEPGGENEFFTTAPVEVEIIREKVLR